MFTSVAVSLKDFVSYGSTNKTRVQSTMATPSTIAHSRSISEKARISHPNPIIIFRDNNTMHTRQTHFRLVIRRSIQDNAIRGGGNVVMGFIIIRQSYELYGPLK